jgi:hypothetical protein
VVLMSRTRRAGRPVIPRAARKNLKPRSGARLWERVTCYGCGQLVMHAEERTPSGRLRGALVSLPGDEGNLARDGEGYIVRDPRRELPGARYTWHACPARPCWQQR